MAEVSPVTRDTLQLHLHQRLRPLLRPRVADITIATALSCVWPTVAAAIVRVPDDAPTIRAAVTQAAAVDEIVIAPGEYTGPGNRDITISGKTLTIRGESSADLTTIRVEGIFEENHRAFLIEGDATTMITLKGLHVTEGYQNGGAVRVRGSANLTIEDCLLDWNKTGETVEHLEGGGAVLAEGHSQVTIRRTIMNYNGWVHGRGGAVLAGEWSRVAISDSQFNVAWGGDGGGVALLDHADLFMERCRLWSCSGSNGGGLYTDLNTEAAVSECLFSGCFAASGGGAISASGILRLTNCTVVASQSTRGGGLYVGHGLVFAARTIFWGNCVESGGDGRDFYIHSDGSVELTCCAAETGGSGGPVDPTVVGPQVTTDPLFCDSRECGAAGGWEVGDFRLQPDSPCAAERSPCGMSIGSEGSCAIEGPFGACCLPDRSCSVTSQERCEDSGGYFLGDGTSCDGVPCAPTPTERRTWGHVKWRMSEGTR